MDYQHFIININIGSSEVKKVIGLIILVCLITQTPVCAIEEHHNSLKIQVKKSKKQPEKFFTLNPFWESYNDDLLNGYISEALENNLDIKIAKTRIKESEAILGTINSQRLPRLSINPSIYPYKTISRWTGLYASHNMLYFPLLLDWELDIFGKLSDKVKSSKYEVQISEQDLNIAKLSLASEITASYFNIVLNDALIKNYEELISNLNETIKLKRQLYDGGIISYDNLYTTEYELVNRQNEFNSLSKKREILLHQFAVLRGISPENNTNIERSAINGLKIPFDINIPIQSDLIYNRPDVMQAELGIKKAAIDVRVAKKMFLPSVNLNEMIGYEALRASRIFNWESTVYQLGAGALLDLYTGGYKMANLRYNKELATEKLHQYNNALLNAFCETENALSSLKTDSDSYDGFYKAMQKSEHYYQVANTRYTNGTGNRIDELDARRQVIINENSMYTAKICMLIDSVDIYKSLGGRIQ